MNDETMIFDSSIGEPKKSLETIGKYKIKSVLGQGAMGIVYKAFDPYIQREVAIKLIHKDLMVSSSGEEVSTRFRLEAQAAGRFSPHNNIVTVYEFGEEDSRPFIVMEYVHGKTLKQWLEADTKFSLQHTYSIMGQLLNGLHYSHSHNVVHRDIKPDNIFLLDSGQVKITDFGIAKIDQTGVTQQGIRIGTPSYMSPEQIEGKSVDGRSDLFSAGVIFYQLLTGKKPFSGDSMASLMHQVVNTKPVAVSIANEELPRSFDAVVEKALAKNPDNRFQTGHEFSLAIKNALEAQASKSITSTISTNQIMVFGGSGLLALLLVGGGFWWFSSNDNSPQKTQMQPPKPLVKATQPSTPSPPPQIKADLYSAESSPPSAIEGNAFSTEPLPKPKIPSNIYSPASAMTDFDVKEQPVEMPAMDTIKADIDYIDDTVAKEDLTQMAKVEETPLVIPPILPTFQARVFYTSSNGLLNELNNGDTLTPSDNYYLTFQPNQEQNLYAAQIDSLGGIYPIFPNKQFNTFSNPLIPGKEYKIPEESNLFLDFNVGKEKIYFIASMEQVNRLELLFDELQRADENTRKELAKEFVDIFEAYNPDTTHSLWFWHK